MCKKQRLYGNGTLHPGQGMKVKVKKRTLLWRRTYATKPWYMCVRWDFNIRQC